MMPWGPAPTGKLPFVSPRRAVFAIEGKPKGGLHRSARMTALQPGPHRRPEPDASPQAFAGRRRASSQAPSGSTSSAAAAGSGTATAKIDSMPFTRTTLPP